VGLVATLSNRLTRAAAGARPGTGAGGGRDRGQRRPGAARTDRAYGRAAGDRLKGAVPILLGGTLDEKRQQGSVDQITSKSKITGHGKRSTVCHDT
jgi:hypothetical protein